MSGGFIRGITTASFGRHLLYAIVAGSVLVVAFLLSGGTGLLESLGLSRHVAGTIATVVTVAVVVAGLVAFAKYAIDW